MEPETRATSSFEKDAHKTKDNASKGKTRSNSLFTISSGFTFFAALPGGSSSSSFSRRGLNFKQLNQDFADEQYEVFLNKLNVEVYVIAQMAFLPGGSAGATRRSPWLKQYPEEFIKHVELVAHPDARSGHWEKVLRNGDERVNLIVAILFRIIDKSIFSPLLFGADPKLCKTLQNSDTELINAEGFERSAVLSHTSRAWLRKNNGEPPLFWQEVDKLCWQSLAMLLPFYDYVEETAVSKPMPKTELYQSLHDLFAHAGWISVCMRMSPAIISIDWNIPGEPFSTELINNSQEAYEASLDAAKAHEASVEKARQYQMMVLGVSGKPRPHIRQVKSAPRVKITVTPTMVRHKPLPKTMNIKGVTSYTIMKPSVVFYEGFKLEGDENKAYTSLPVYIQKLRDRNCVPEKTVMTIMALATIWMWVSFTTRGQQTWQIMQQWLQSVQ
ncbi:hypothetical protein FVEN_g9211 [Fusarium venenatum]|uniref:Uncharacterized protein n=1 Tax=Fusarium venenatum TaxID=56646 RepID=A0A2L2TL76_9HYPO|nr:uncharacterized protein FVRRES_00428 [Fusarium venenatum]KAG8352828.1 hypothetical protein FVEN_g9211 [Fusarium venenatum]CEI63916.1 unnamed protein product [Fusarium venenatum]